MSHVLIVTGSPSSSSRTLRLAGVLRQRLSKLGLESSLLDLRELPAEDLLHARANAPAVAAALDRVRVADGVVFATPLYKAAYSGLIKTFIDILPQFGLRDKVVLPIALGATPTHALALDYALRPVLSSLEPLQVVAGLFVLDKQIGAQQDGAVELDGELSSKVDASLAHFVNALGRAALPTRAQSIVL
jgi:FMN reductase